jgi:hypothetical protein
MTDIASYAAKALAWLQSVEGTFGSAARKGLSVEADWAAAISARNLTRAMPGSTGRPNLAGKA